MVQVGSTILNIALQHSSGGMSTLPYLLVLFVLISMLLGLVYLYYKKKYTVEKEHISRLEKQFNEKSREVAENKFKLLQLNEKYDKLFLALEKSSNIVIFCDEQYRLLWVNKGFCKLFDLELEEFLTSSAKTLDEFFKPFFVQRLDENLHSARQQVIEVEITTPSGENKFLSFTVELLKDENNESHEFVLIGTDVTLNKAVYRDLGISEEKFRTIFEKANDAIFLMDEDKFIDCNSKTLDIFNTEKENIVGNYPYRFSPELQEDGTPSKDKALKYISAAYSGIPQKFDWTHQTYHGKPFFAEVSLNLTNIESRPALLAVVRDISSRKYKENIQNVLHDITVASLEENSLDNLFESIHKALARVMDVSNFYIALFDDITDMLSFPYFIDQEDSVPESRKSGKGLTEYALKQKESILLGKEDFDQLKDSGEIEYIGAKSINWLGAPLVIGSKIIGCVVVQSYDPQIIFSEDDKNLFTFMSSQIANGIYKKRSEIILQDSQQRLKELNKNKDALFAIIGHDLKSPLHALLGFSEMLMNDIDELTTSEVKSYAENINEISNDIHHLLENLLNWSRFQSNRMIYEPDNIDIVSIIRETAGLLKAGMHRKNITFEFNHPDELRAYADEYHIKTVLRNIISNAIKFTFTDGKISINAARSEGLTTITVSDTGKGIPKDEQESLFDETQLMSRVGTENEQGTGLGLIICKDMIVKNNGQIFFESEEGEGTSFTIELPAYKN